LGGQLSKQNHNHICKNGTEEHSSSCSDWQESAPFGSAWASDIPVTAIKLFERGLVGSSNSLNHFIGTFEHFIAVWSANSRVASREETIQYRVHVPNDQRQWWDKFSDSRTFSRPSQCRWYDYG
jgi:hypothetical protein